MQVLSTGPVKSRLEARALVTATRINDGLADFAGKLGTFSLRCGLPAAVWSL